MFQNPIDHWGLDQTRVNTIHADSQRSHFRGYIARESLDRQLGRRVVSTSRQHLARLDGTNINDGTRAPRRYGLAAENLGAEPLSPQISVDQIAPLLISQVQKRNNGFDARVVHQHVHPPQFSLRSLEHSLDLRALPDVCLEHQCPPAFTPDPFRDHAGLLARSDVVDDEVGALLGEHFGDAFADPLARSGNERYFIAELHGHLLPQWIVQPPSTISTCPTTISESGLERNSTAPTRSSG